MDRFEEEMRKKAPSWSAFDIRMMFESYLERGFAAESGGVEALTNLLGHSPRRYEDFAEEAASGWLACGMREITGREYKEQRMSEKKDSPKQTTPAIPPDDPQRKLAIAQADRDGKSSHIGVVGDTYTILLTDKDTAGQFCLIDMYIPPGGGPPPHRHDFEETFTLLEGELDVTFRGAKQMVRAGDTINVPANAPHQFHNSSRQPARMLCICSPPGQEEFFLEVGVLVATRTSPPPKLDEAAEVEFRKKAVALSPKYRTELLERA
jgi:quercetin dioxygenase-like cupin family protein